MKPGELDLEPFREWAAGRIRAHDGIEAWAARVGMDGTNLRRYALVDTPQARAGIALELADRILTADGTARLEDIWPQFADEPTLEPEAFCPRCRELVTPIGGRCPWCETATEDGFDRRHAYCEAEDRLVMPAVDGSCWRCGGPLKHHLPYDPCACGCGELVNRFEPSRGRRVHYVRGHASRQLERGTMVPAAPFREHLLASVRSVDPLMAVALQHSMQREDVAAILAGDVSELDRQDVRDWLWRAGRYGQGKGKPNRVGVPRLGELYPEYARSKICPGLPELGIECGRGKAPHAQLCRRCFGFKRRRDRGLRPTGSQIVAERWHVGDHVLAEAKRLRDEEALTFPKLAERLLGQTPHRNARSLTWALRNRFRQRGWDTTARTPIVPDAIARRALELRVERNATFRELGEEFAGELGLPVVTAEKRLYKAFRRRGWSTARRTKGLPLRRADRVPVAA